MTFASFEFNAQNRPIPLLNRKRIHSFYDPQKEVKRFLEIQLKEKSKVVIIVGESFGYLTEQVIQMGKKAIAVGLDAFMQLSPFSQNSIFSHPQSFFYPVKEQCWNLEEAKNFFSLMEEKIAPTEWKAIQLILWEPLVKQCPFFYELATHIAQQILAKGSSFKTGEYFMGKWISNAFHHLSEKHHYYALPKLEAPLIICAAGPSLKSHLDFIKEVKNRFYLLALSSALSVLFEANIKPDFIIQTDGGYWATRLFGKIQEKIEKENQPYLISTISAGWIRDYPHRILINQQTALEKIFPIEPIFATEIEETPSVACAALAIGVKMSKEVFFIGLDLASNKEISHAIPHPSINRIFNQSNQLNSFQKKLYENYVDGHFGTLKRYSYWFELALKKGASFYQIAPTYNPTPFQPVQQEWIRKKFSLSPKKKIEISLLKSDFKISKEDILTSIQTNKKALIQEYLPHLEKENQEKKWLEVMRVL